MIAARITPRRGVERFLAIFSAIAVFASLMVAFAPVALAHHPEISANQVCADGAVKISYESISWKTDGTSGSAHDDIRIEVRVNNSGPWTQVANGAYNAGNNYRFSGTFDAAGYSGQSIVVRARANGAWTNGQGGGETRQTSPILVNLVCSQNVTVTPAPQACAVNQQGAPTGSVSFDINPASGATVRVYTNSNFTGQVGGVLGDDQVLSLAPGTYYWRATAASGYTMSGAASGQFTITPCTASVTVSAGVCAVNGNGAPVAPASVTINPTSGATVVISGPGGPYNFSGTGGNVNLGPGSYSWTATPTGGFSMGGSGSGQFTIDPCETSTIVVSGQCAVNANGAPLGSVTVTIDPASGATVVISGPGGPYNFSGTGGTVSLAPGTYSWTATPGKGFSISGPGSGQFEIDPCTSAVTLSPAACQVVGGVPVGSVTVSIDPSSGATVIVTGPGGPFAFSGSGGSENLTPGSYTWEATAADGFTLTGATSGSFTIEPCAASVSVSGSCLLDGNAGSGLIEVTIGGSATVEIFDGTTLVDTLTTSGTITVAEGKTYTWAASAGSGFDLVGAASGEVDIEACSRLLDIEVSGVCLNDVPYLTWTVKPIGFTATETTITWLDIDSSNALHSSVEALSGTMVWPGAVVGSNGKAVDWPGWVFVDKATKQPVPLGTEGGTWVKGADGFENTRPETLIQFEVNPTATVEVDYPGGEPTCSGPPDEVLDEEIENDTDSNDDPDVLPFTGVDAGSMLAVAAVLLGSGWVLVRSARRLEGRD